jgi:hypothetical protein
MSTNKQTNVAGNAAEANREARLLVAKVEKNGIDNQAHMCCAVCHPLTLMRLSSISTLFILK